MKVRAYAKINLSLDVLGLRPDGFHELTSLMQSVSLADEMLLSPAETELTLSTDDPTLPAGEENIIIRALENLRHEAGYTCGLSIDLRKKIPVAAGLAGGSADAAGVLAGAARIWNLSLSREKLLQAGAAVGSDVPFCLQGGTALARGRGEILFPLPTLDIFLLLIKPPVAVSTPAAYAAWDAAGKTSRRGTERLLGYWEQGDVEGVARHLSNDMSDTIAARHPVVEQARRALLRAGALGACMSGSGPSVFGIMEDEESARKACGDLSRTQEVHLCRTMRQGVEMEEAL